MILLPKKRNKAKKQTVKSVVYKAYVVHFEKKCQVLIGTGKHLRALKKQFFDDCSYMSLLHASENIETVRSYVSDWSTYPKNPSLKKEIKVIDTLSKTVA
jgi:hypothetical protein